MTNYHFLRLALWETQEEGGKAGGVRGTNVSLIVDFTFTRCIPVEVSFDSLLDQPERMMGCVVEVAADLRQELWRDVGVVVTRVGVAQHLHRVLTNHRLRGGSVCAEASA